MLSTDASLKSSPTMAQPMFSRVWGFDEMIGFLQAELLPQGKVSQAAEGLRGKRLSNSFVFCWWVLQGNPKPAPLIRDTPLGNVDFTSARFSKNR